MTSQNCVSLMQGVMNVNCECVLKIVRVHVVRNNKKKYWFCAVPFTHVSLQVFADEQRAVRSCQLGTSASLHLKTKASLINWNHSSMEDNI